MKRSSWLLTGLLAGSLLLSPAVRADEGMWLFSSPPRERLAKDHNFKLEQAWLDHVMRAAVRFNNGGSGGFVSSEGLVVTNHHIGADSLQKLSTPERNLVAEGFYAATRSEELKCPDLELNCLQSIEDVTARVDAAVQSGMSAEQAGAARRATMSAIEKESTETTGLRSDVITLYQGGAYHLYRFKKYTDVRLVMAPEQKIAFFGGDVDNFEYPRYDLDVAFFRVYENGQPLQTRDYLPFNPEGARDGELVFVVGNPGRTNRLDTLARLLHLRDLTLPYRLAQFRAEEASLRQYGERSPEAARQAQSALYSVANARKAYTGQLQGLLDPKILEHKATQEAALRRRLAADPKLAAAGQAFAAIETSQKKLREFEREYYLLEAGQATDSRLFTIARQLVRLSQELARPNGERLREYRDSNLESLKLELFSPAPIYPELEKATLGSSLQFAAEQLGAENPLVVKLLDGHPPGEQAARLVSQSRLGDPAERRRLFAGGQAAIAASQDPMIVLARSLDADSRALRRRYELEVVEPERQSYGQIAQAMFALDGPTQAPDATFSLRLAYGVVKGYTADGAAVPWCTRVADAFQLAAANDNRPPFQLPDSWLRHKADLPGQLPFDFVSTADTIGGNSGSPVIDRQGRLVGVNFDRNRFGLVRNFIYSEAQARHVAVHAKLILEALERIYGAGALVKELTAAGG